VHVGLTDRYSGLVTGVRVAFGGQFQLATSGLSRLSADTSATHGPTGARVQELCAVALSMELMMASGI